MVYADQLQMQLAVHAAVRIEGTQKAAAARFGVSESYLSDILRGNRDVPDKIARLFGVYRAVVYLPLDGDEAERIRVRTFAEAQEVEA